MRDLACRAAIRNTPPLCRIHVIRAGSIVFRRHDGLHNSIPIYCWRAFRFARSRGAR
jgi:hypothetical protein